MENKSYTLRQLLGGDITLMIPGMQRDYCWGSAAAPGAGEKVTGFISTLAHLFRKGATVTLGLLYGYESPAGSRHISIIDGQQRLTTLYLLTGMLHRRTPRPDLRRLLITDYKLIDDREPRLLYQVRPEAMYFMSDLVTNFFLNRDGRLSQLENSPWYFADYANDPSVVSFTAALRSIDNVLERALRTPGWDFDAFADYVVDKLVLYYHDLGSREQAERMFITINTTPLPLTLSQRIKSTIPAFAGGGDNDTISRWEEMERWAWTHRPRGGTSAHTSDTRMDNMLAIYLSKCRLQELTHHETADFGRLHAFFRTYSTLAACVPTTPDITANDTDGMFVVLTLTHYISRWGLDENDSKQIQAMHLWLNNQLRYQHMSASGADTLAAIKVIDAMPSADLLSLLDVRPATNPKLLNDEELTKLRLLARMPRQRDILAGLIETAQRHPMLQGRVSVLISWSTDKKTGRTDTDTLRHYTDSIYRIWGEDIDAQPRLDLLRRAMLTLRHKGYPIVRRGDTTLSLCWRDYDWQRLMKSQPGLIRQIIDRISNPRRAPGDMMRAMVDKFADKSWPFHFLVKNPGAVESCSRRSLMRPCQVFTGYHPTGDDTRPHWYVEQMPLEPDPGRWSALRTYGTRCLYTDHKRYNIAVNIHYQPESRNPYRLEAFARPAAESDGREDIDPREIVYPAGGCWTLDKRTGRYTSQQRDAHQVINIIKNI